MHVQFGARLAHSIVKILHSRNGGDPWLEAASVVFEPIQIRPVQLDFNRTCGAGEIVDHVGKDLHELDAQSWHRSFHLHSHIIDHLENRARPLTRRSEPRHDVTGVLRGREQSELGAGATRRTLDLWSPGQNSLDDVDLTIRFRQRRSTRCEVVEDECAFIHLG